MIKLGWELSSFTLSSAPMLHILMAPLWSDFQLTTWSRSVYHLIFNGSQIWQRAKHRDYPIRILSTCLGVWGVKEALGCRVMLQYLDPRLWERDIKRFVRRVSTANSQSNSRARNHPKPIVSFFETQYLGLELNGANEEIINYCLYARRRWWWIVLC